MTLNREIVKYYGAYSLVSIHDDIAIKSLKANNYSDVNETSSDFIREVILLSMLKCRSDYIINIKSINMDEESFTMDSYPYDLTQFIPTNGKQILSNENFKKIIFQIIIGLSHLENNKILHRDIKPDNILVDDSLNIRIIDFNISSYGDQSNEKFGESKYNDYDRTQTITYRSPESLLFLDSPYIQDFSKMDIWSLGIIILNHCWGYDRMSRLIHNDGRLEIILFYMFLSCDNISENSQESIKIMRSRLVDNYIHPYYNNLIFKYFCSLTDNGNFESMFDLLKNKDICCFTYKTQWFVDYNNKSSLTTSDFKIHDFDEILDKIIMFEPINRLSANELINLQFFDDIRDLYLIQKYNTYNPIVNENLINSELMQEVRPNIITLLDFYTDKYNFSIIHKLNALYIIDQYFSLDDDFIENNKIVRIEEENIEKLVIVCLGISLKLYRYINNNIENNLENMDYRREDPISYSIRIFSDFGLALGKDIVAFLHDKLYAPSFMTTNINIAERFYKYMENTNYIFKSYNEIL